MKDGAILANSGHFDVEVEVAACAGCPDRETEVRQNLAEFQLPSGKTIYLLAQGRLVGQVAAEASPASVMDLSFAGLALSARYLLANAAHWRRRPRRPRCPRRAGGSAQAGGYRSAAGHAGRQAGAVCALLDGRDAGPVGGLTSRGGLTECWRAGVTERVQRRVHAPWLPACSCSGGRLCAWSICTARLASAS